MMKWLYRLLNITLKEDRLATIKALGLVLDIQELHSTPHRHIIEINMGYGPECWMLLTMDEDDFFSIGEIDVNGRQAYIIDLAKLILVEGIPTKKKMLREQGFDVGQALFRK
jgi:hypothetical protein